MKYIIITAILSLAVLSCSGGNPNTSSDTGFHTDTYTGGDTGGDVFDSGRPDTGTIQPELRAFEVVDQAGNPLKCTNSGSLNIRMKWANAKIIRFSNKNDGSGFSFKVDTDNFVEKNGWMTTTIDLDSHFTVPEDDFPLFARAENGDLHTEYKGVTFKFDITPPQVTDVQVSAEAVKPGTKVTFTVKFSEDVHDVRFSSSVSGTTNKTDARTFTFDVEAPDRDSTLSPKVTAADCAGNTLKEFQLQKQVTVDATPPQARGIDVTPGPFKAGDQVKVTFDSSEALQADPTMTIDGETAKCSGESNSYTCIITVSDKISDGNHDIFLDLTDLVGNTAHVKAGTALFDSTPPALIKADITPKLARQGTKILVSMEFSEAVDLKSKIKSSMGTPGFACQADGADARSYTCTWTVTDMAADGEYKLSVDVADKAGNPFATDLGSFWVDNTKPVISNVQTPQYISGSGSYGSDEFSVSFSVSEEAAIAWVQVGSQKFTHFTQNPGTSGFDLKFDNLQLPPQEREGEKTITIHVQDQAGNYVEATAKTTYDKTKPTVTATLDPPKATTGTKVTLTLAFSEQVRDLAFKDLAFECTSQDQQNFTCTYTIKDTDTQNSYEIAIMVKDLAGNRLSSDFQTVATLEIDRNGPKISNIRVSPDRARHGDTVTVKFNTDETCETPNVKIGDTDAETCTPAQGTGFTCTHVVSDTETEGVKTIRISVKDRAGNAGEDSSQTVTYDFSPPGVKTAKLQRTPELDSAILGENHVLFSTRYPGYENHMNPAKVTAVVTLTGDEDVDTLHDVPQLEARNGDHVIKFSRTGALEFKHEISATDPEGDYTFFITWSDTIGNKGTRQVPGMTMRIDQTPPAASELDQDKVAGLRVPWGSTDTGGKARLTCAGKAGAVGTDIAYVSLVVASHVPVTPVKTGADGSFTVSQEVGYYLAGHSTQNHMLLRLYDSSGLGSDPIRIQNMSLIVSPGDGYKNPLKMAKTPDLQTWKDAATTSLSTEDRQLTALPDTDHALSVPNAMQWQRLESGDPERPGAMQFHSMQYNSSSGLLTLVTGNAFFVYSDAFRAWKNIGFVPYRTLDDGAASVYDPDSDRLYVFGGGGGYHGNKTLAYDFAENKWIAAYDDTLAPPPIALTNGWRAVLNPLAHKVLIYVSNYISLYDIPSNTWTAPKMVASGKRGYYALVHHTQDDVFYVFGGETSSGFLGDMWSITGNGDSIEQVDLSGSTHPGPRSRFEFAKYKDQGFYIVGGMDGSGLIKETWYFDFASQTWSKRADAPDVRLFAALVYDPNHDRMVMYGGKDAPNDSRMLAYYPKTDTWAVLSDSQAEAGDAPAQYRDFAMAFDENAKKMVFFSGQQGNGFADTRIWDQASGIWTHPTVTNTPMSRVGHAMCYSKYDHRVYMFGGHRYGTYDNAIYAFDTPSLAWTKLTGTTSPKGRSGHVMACTDDGRVIVAGGFDSTGAAIQDTYVWDIESESWTKIDGLPAWKQPFAGAMSGGKFYAIGRDADNAARFAVFDPAQSAWSVLDVENTPDPGDSPALTPCEGGVCLFAKMDHTVAQNQMWKYDVAENTWSRLEPVGQSPHYTPPVTLAFDTSTNAIFMYDTDEFDTTDAHMWRLAAPETARPGFIVDFNLSDVLPAGFLFTGGAIDVSAAGTAGSKLYAWNYVSGQWDERASNTAFAGSPADDWKMHHNFDIFGPFSKDIEEITTDGNISLAIGPADAGKDARTLLDYVQIEVDYQDNGSK